MESINLSQVKAAVGREKLSVLADVFHYSIGIPPGVPAARYKADHPQWIEVLADLESHQLLLKRDRTSRNYELRVFALPLIESERAKDLLALMNDLYLVLKTFYNERLGEKVEFREILEKSSAEPSLVKEALYYMTDSHAVWSGMSEGFPFIMGSSMCVSESILKYKNFYSVLYEFYEWHIPRKKGWRWGRRVKSINESIFGETTTGKKESWWDLPVTRTHWFLAALIALTAIVVHILVK